MAGDSEKQIRKILDTLSQSPKPKPSLSSGEAVGSLVGKRRAESGLRGNIGKGLRPPAAASIESLGMAPPCRPWDRGDLMRRLATFKAMTWFGKPKVISPVNCARRGWINIEMDVIVCEACGARLLFSTPSSGSMQQVEKAAAVFSLKLDNGHKQLCPWINNACDEALALFPPTPSLALVDSYKERSSALVRLTALPLISSSAIEYMKSPQLEHFLSQPHPLITLNGGIRLVDNSKSKDLEGTSGAVTDDLYYQAQKLISLCGWEPRLLPYVVDHEDQTSLLSENAHPSESSMQIPGKERDSTIIYSSSGLHEIAGEKDIQYSLGEHQYDPASVVLDCKFCGACVGLWAFATVQRPLEYFTLLTDSSGETESATCSSDLVNVVEAPGAESFCKRNQYSIKEIGDTGYIGSTSRERPLGLSMTIAGGPPPTKQNYRPRVSFPVISRHLRAEFAFSSGARNYVPTNISSGNQVNAQFLSQHSDPSEQQKDINGDLDVQSVGAGSLKRKRSENEVYVSGSNDDQSVENGHRSEEKSAGISSERRPDAQGSHSLHEGIANIDSYKDLMQNSDLQRSDRSSGKAMGDMQRSGMSSGDPEENSLHSDNEANNSLKNGESIQTASDANVTIRDAAVCENNSIVELTVACNAHDDGFSRVDLLNMGETSGSNQHYPSLTASCLAPNATLPGTHSIETERGNKTSEFQNLEDGGTNGQKANGLRNMGSSADREEDAGHASGMNLFYNKTSKFDVIRLHKPFCPWIVPEDGEKNLPGWKLTLSALAQQENDQSLAMQSDAPSTLLDEVEDPVVSIRRLFASPPMKKLKGIH